MGRRSAAAHAEPACRLVRFEAADGVALAGLLYEPRRATKRAIIWLHGGGGASVFESRRTNLLGEIFVGKGIAFFPFNNRGSGIVRRAGDGLGGSAFERIRDCVADIDGAIRELWRRGYRDITLAGHSTGANKIAVYDHYKPRNRAKRYVLLAGGDDTGLLYAQLGARRFKALLTKSNAMIKAKRGDEFAPPIEGQTMLSWRAFYDVANPDGDYNVFPFFEAMTATKLSRRPLFRYIGAIRKPSLYIYGDRDEYCFDDVPRCVAILSQYVSERAEIVVMRDADHGFSGLEPQLGAAIVDWIIGG
jgi:pimeloyl-ACP methyl ester carboxylesterase